MQVPQIIKNWTILVSKPMVSGIPHFKKPLKWENGSKLLKNGSNLQENPCNLTYLGYSPY